MQEYIPADKLAHVQRVLYGWNMGKAVEAVPLAPPLADAAVNCQNNKDSLYY